MKSISFKYRFASFLINLIASTWRIEIVGKKPQKKGIVVFWHGFMLPGWYSFRNTNACAVVSLSKDGQILSYQLSEWDFALIRGSSSRGGSQVLQEITDAASENIVLMTPDGPRGPKYTLKAGAVIAAMRSGAPLHLCGIKIGFKFTFRKSWDNFILPLPFSNIKLVYSEAISIDKNLDSEQIEKLIQDLSNKLNQLYN